MSTSRICMAVLGRLTPAWSGQAVMGWRLVKKMAKKIFQNRVARSTGGVTWRHRGVFPIRLDRWKAQGVYFLNMHGHARPSHNGLERSDRHGLEVGQKNDEKIFFQNRVARSTGGVTWRHCGVFPIRLDRWKAQSVYFSNMHGRARPSHTGLQRSDRHGLEVGQKNGKKKFAKPGCHKYRGGNLAPPWSFSNPFGPLESPRCLLLEYAWPC